MGKGYTTYECKCGGNIYEEWDHQGFDCHCDKCDNPIPAKEEILSDIKNESEQSVNRELPF